MTPALLKAWAGRKVIQVIATRVRAVTTFISKDGFILSHLRHKGSHYTIERFDPCHSNTLTAQIGPRQEYLWRLDGHNLYSKKRFDFHRIFTWDELVSR